MTWLIWLETELEFLDILGTLLVSIGSRGVEIDIDVEVTVLFYVLSLLFLFCLFCSCLLFSLFLDGLVTLGERRANLFFSCHGTLHPWVTQDVSDSESSLWTFLQHL